MKAILEMELPESCTSCELSVYLHLRLPYPRCGFHKKPVEDFNDNRHPDCPLKIVEDNKEKGNA